VIQTEPNYSIVIPVFNSDLWLEELVARIDQVMDQEVKGEYELILVNDCSPNSATWKMVVRIASQYSCVRGFDLLYNVGQFRATLCGLKHARGDFCIIMDDDLQHPPEELPKLISAINQSEDLLCVMGSYESKKHGMLRNLGSMSFHKLLSWLYDKPSNIQTSSFRIMRRTLVDAILVYKTAKPQMGPMIVSLTKKIDNVSVRHEPRQQGQSGYSLRKLISSGFDNIINSSTLPLRFFSMIGFLSASGSILLSIYFLFRKLSVGINLEGFTSQILLIIFFGGMTLAGIGLLGEYIARIISETTGPEQFRIKEIVGQINDKKDTFQNKE